MDDKQPTIAETMKGDAPEILVHRYSEGTWSKTSAHVPGEMELTVYINGQELVTIMCTPTKLTNLVLGFLLSEGIITSMKDVAMMRVCEDDSLAEVRLTNQDFKMPTKRTLTSGCGGGASFTTEGQKVDSQLVITPEEALSLMKQLQDKMDLYQLSGGVHASALADAKKLLVVAEDIGRHNTLDKIQGECLLRGIPVKDGVLLSTGRISSEMVRKAAKMRVPVVISRTSPTGRAIQMANEWDISLIGYARGNRLIVYSHPERLGQ